MFIIWGTKGIEKHLGFSAQPYRCQHCNNTEYYKIMRVRTWFTLFWIPIFPISSKYFITCPICNYGMKLKKEEALAMVEQQQGR